MSQSSANHLRRGARVIKVVTSGSVFSGDDDAMLQQFSEEELKVIVSEASRMGLACAAHAIRKAGIMAAIKAGFKVIEHDSYGNDEVFTAMKKHDVMLVATITVLQSILENIDNYPPKIAERVEKLARNHWESYKKAIKAGVECALGSDLGGGVGTILSPGLNGREVVYAVQAGMSPLEAIEAATANGPDTLCPQAHVISGQIREGFDADFLGLVSSPLDDIEVLQTPACVKYIWKGGKLVKAPGLDPWDVLEG